MEQDIKASFGSGIVDESSLSDAVKRGAGGLVVIVVQKKGYCRVYSATRCSGRGEIFG